MSDVSKRASDAEKMVRDLSDYVKETGGSLVLRIAWPTDVIGEYEMVRSAIGTFQNTPVTSLAAIAVDDPEFKARLFEAVMALVPMVVSGMYETMPEEERTPLVAAAVAFYATISVSEAKELLLAEIEGFRDELNENGLLNKDGTIDFNRASAFILAKIAEHAGQVQEDEGELSADEVLREASEIVGE